MRNGFSLTIVISRELGIACPNRNKTIVLMTAKTLLVIKLKKTTIKRTSNASNKEKTKNTGISKLHSPPKIKYMTREQDKMMSKFRKRIRVIPRIFPKRNPLLLIGLDNAM